MTRAATPTSKLLLVLAIACITPVALLVLGSGAAQGAMQSASVAQSEYGGTCSYDSGSKTVTIALGSALELAWVRVSGGSSIMWGESAYGAIDPNQMPGYSACGAATVTNTDTIRFTGSGEVQGVVLDMRGNATAEPFAPGATPEATGTSEIEFDFQLVCDVEDVDVIGSRLLANDIRVGTAGVNLNADDDADLTGLPFERVSLFGGNLADSLSGAGGAGTGSTYTGRMQITGGDGDDMITGGSDEDTFWESSHDWGTPSYANGADTISGGGNTWDEVVYWGRVNGLSVTLADGLANDGEPGENDLVRADVELVYSGQGDDVLVGSSSDNRLMGFAGNDAIYGGGGADYLFGEDGNDAVYGGAGDDHLVESEQADGGDTLSGGAGNDQLDYSFRTNGVTVTLADGLANDGEPGEGDLVRYDIETVLGGPGDDTLVGGPGPDELLGNEGHNTLVGGGHHDRLTAGNGGSVFYGGSGDDEFVAGSGADTFSGGSGADSITYAGRTSPISATLGDGIANDGEAGEGDLIRSDVEHLTGGTGSDYIVGNASANWLYGSGGNDAIYGSGGDDELLGGSGSDTLYGGDGADSFNQEEYSNGADTLVGGNGSDSVTYGARANPVTVTLADGLANDGEAGENDLVRADVEDVYGGSGNDTLTGSSVANSIQAGGGNDTVFAGAGDDTLTGGAGNDSLYGSDGDDHFYAQDGLADVLNGGNGNDTADTYDVGIDTLVGIP